MPKNIVVYSDGTGQDGGARVEQHISNVYKMYRTSRGHPDNSIQPSEQVCFYDPGLGTDIGASGFTAVARRIDKALQSVTGRGITRNMADCYEFIINHYEDGDRIYMIGFSRGAYTVRALANAIMLCGIPTKAENGPLLRFRKQIHDIAKEAVETVYEHGAGHPREEFEDEREEQARRFREKYGSNYIGQTDDAQRSNAAAYFVGVFDPVAALGASGFRRFAIQAILTLLFGLVAFLISTVFGLIAAAIAKVVGFGFWFSAVIGIPTLFAVLVAWFVYRQRAQYTKTIKDFPQKGDVRKHQAEWKSAYFDRLLSKYVFCARSANSIDERRKDFDRVTWGQPDSHQLSQFWFAGNHSDVGGSYAEAESRLSDISLQWMLEESMNLPHPILFGPVTVHGNSLEKTGKAGTPLHLFPDVTSMQHSEIAGTQDTVDSLREHLPWLLRWTIPHANYEIIKRSIPNEAKVHPSVHQRFELATVVDCAKDVVGPYRPEALREHTEFRKFYSDLPQLNAPPVGRSDEAS